MQMANIHHITLFTLKLYGLHIFLEKKIYLFKKDFGASIVFQMQ